MRAFLFASLFLLAGHAGPAPLIDSPPAAAICTPPDAPPARQHCRPLLPGEDILHPGHFLPPAAPPMRPAGPPKGYTVT